jgi:hypothetical protein
LANVKDQDIAVYAVWFPALGIDSKASLPFATKYFPDSRVRHYWDAEAKLGHAYSPILKTDQVVWDVYMLFDRDAEWKDQPPAPVYIMDKIGLEVAKPLDGVELANEIVRLRNSSQPSR